MATLSFLNSWSPGGTVGAESSGSFVETFGALGALGEFRGASSMIGKLGRQGVEKSRQSHGAFEPFIGLTGTGKQIL